MTGKTLYEQQNQRRSTLFLCVVQCNEHQTLLQQYFEDYKLYLTGVVNYTVEHDRRLKGHVM